MVKQVRGKKSPDYCRDGEKHDWHYEKDQDRYRICWVCYRKEEYKWTEWIEE